MWKCLAEVLPCPGCGRLTPRGGRYCSWCGAPYRTWWGLVLAMTGVLAVEMAALGFLLLLLSLPIVNP